MSKPPPHLKEQRLLSVFRVPLLGDPVARPPDLDKLFDVHPRLLRGGLHGGLLGLLGGTAGQVALMLLALRSRHTGLVQNLRFAIFVIKVSTRPCEVLLQKVCCKV